MMMKNVAYALCDIRCGKRCNVLDVRCGGVMCWMSDVVV